MGNVSLFTVYVCRQNFSLSTLRSVFHAQHEINETYLTRQDIAMALEQKKLLYGHSATVLKSHLKQWPVRQLGLYRSKELEVCLVIAFASKFSATLSLVAI